MAAPPGSIVGFLPCPAGLAATETAPAALWPRAHHARCRPTTVETGGSQRRFTHQEQAWNVGYDATQATYFAQVETAGVPDIEHQPGADAGRVAPDEFAEDSVRTVVGDHYGQVRCVADLQRALARQVRLPEHVLIAGAQEGRPRSDPHRDAAAATRATRTGRRPGRRNSGGPRDLGAR